MRESQVIILQGGTGSGKTTQMVQFILDETKERAIPGLIGCTQPRVIAAAASARRVAEEIVCEIGEVVGYRVRFDNHSSDRTRIMFMTDGILVHELLADELLKKYSYIILDEAHVRSVNLDVLLPMLRKTCRRRKDFRLVISSATIDADRFADYFRAPPVSSFGRRGPSAAAMISAPIIRVDGQEHPVQEIYDTAIFAAADGYDDDPGMRKRSKYALAAALKVKEIVGRREPGDILVFLPGQDEIEECCDELHMIADELHAPLDIRPLFGALPSHLQNDVLRPTPAGRRKVVVATNIAETSLTIKGVVHVIDTGVAKEARFDPVTGFHWIEEAKISKYSAIQRAGRAGRTAPGKCYRLYSEQQYEQMETSDQAEITRADLAETMLQMKKLNVTNVSAFPFMQPPSMPYFVKAYDDLVAIGAIDGENGTITTHGEMIMKLALEPCLANALIRSAEYACSEELLIIVSLISVDCAKRLSELAAQKRQQLRTEVGDHLTLLNVYRKWTVEGGCGQRWCDENFVYFQTMANAKKIFNQIGGQLAFLGVPRRSCGPHYGHVQSALAACFGDKAAWHSGGGVYVWLADKAQQFEKKTRVVASMDSDLHKNPRKLVVCHKVVVSGSSKKRQMQLVTEVEKHMLPESVRVKVPDKKAWTPGDDVMKAWRESKNASMSEESARLENSSANDVDDEWGW